MNKSGAWFFCHVSLRDLVIVGGNGRFAHRHHSFWALVMAWLFCHVWKRDLLLNDMIVLASYDARMNFRRYYVPNAQIFITQVVQNREPIFKNERYLDLLRETMREAKKRHPFKMIAYVFLPDHFHLLIQPSGVSNFSQIMHSCKRNFTLNYKQHKGINGSLKFWQKRFFDHIIRDQRDFKNHVDYIHYNPVKHGYAKHSKEWPHSSYHEWYKRGFYS